MYNNAINTSIYYMPFELNCNYYLHVFFEQDKNSCLSSKTANKLAQKLLKLLAFSCENLYHTQKSNKKLTIKALSLGTTYLVIKFG